MENDLYEPLSTGDRSKRDGSKGAAPAPTLAQIRSTALAWLGRQEYYLYKFRQKLQALQATEEQIELVVEEFVANQWLSEQRYCDSFVRSRVNKGQGLIRIRADGRQKGLQSEVLNDALAQNDTDWFELAEQTYQRRFADSPIKDMKEKAKRMRFMQYRGFTMEQIKYALAEED